MLRKTFEQEIQQLKDDILILGSMVEQSLLEAVDALKKRDLAFQHRRRLNGTRKSTRNVTTSRTR